MEQIISPWFFYWINVVESLGCALCVFALLFAGSLVFSTIGFFVNCDETCGDEDQKKVFKKAIKILIAPFIICLFCSIFIPSKTTLIQMVVADKLTYKNVEKVLDGGKNIKNEPKQDVMDILNAIGEKNDVSTNK